MVLDVKESHVEGSSASRYGALGFSAMEPLYALWDGSDVEVLDYEQSALGAGLGVSLWYQYGCVCQKQMDV